MTTHTDIPDSDIDPESPGTTTLFFRLRDNPKAVWEGDPTAPKIAYNALGPPTVSGGTTYKISDVGNESTISPSYTNIIEWQVSLSGTVNVYFGLVDVILGVFARARIYVNGSPVGVEHLADHSVTTYYSENVSISAGDLIQIYAKTSDSASPAEVVSATLRSATMIPGSVFRTV